MPTQYEDQQVTFVGRTNFRGAERIFGIKKKDRRQHMYVIGKTGTGKTTLLENLVLQDVQMGHGLAIIDPHGEFVEHIAERIPKSRANDVVYFNPIDGDYPIGFNVLEVPDTRYKHLVVSDLLGIFTKIWANVWSARMEYILQNCILALIDTPGTTLLGIPRILVDRTYREQIVANVKDPVVRSFWIHEYETWRDQFRNEAIVPIQNKVGQFLNTSFIRNIVGQSKSTMNIPEIMNTGKILLVNVSKGRIGEDNSQLLGAMIITKLQLASMERIRVSEDERIDFYLYVDEFQNFATDSFASILSEARKYRLNLTIAHQYVGQLETDVSTKVRDAVFGNVGTMMTFRVGAMDAEFLEKEFEPEFMMQDLIGLPNHHIYLKLMVDGVTSRPFSAVTLPPLSTSPEFVSRLRFDTDFASVDSIIEISRTHYARRRENVEDDIERWNSAAGMDGASLAGNAHSNQTFEAICWNCGKQANVPFKPDGKRPVYCAQCMRAIEEGKLIPLPERMPHVGRARFGATLNELGIEFPMAGGGEDSRRSAYASPQGGVERPRERISQPIPERQPMRARSYGREEFSNRGQVQRGHREAPQYNRGRENYAGRDYPESRTRAGAWKGERIAQNNAATGPFASQPVVRTPGGGQKVSLAELRNQEKASSGRDLRERGGTGSNAEKRPEVNTSELRSVLEEFLKEKKEKPQATPPVPKKDDEQNGKGVMKPGDKITF